MIQDVYVPRNPRSSTCNQTWLVWLIAMLHPFECSPLHGETCPNHPTRWWIFSKSLDLASYDINELIYKFDQRADI